MLRNGPTYEVREYQWRQAFQAADGSWGVRWYEGQSGEGAEVKPTEAEGKPVGGDGLRVLATGHQVEWMLLLPAEMLDRHDLTVERAAA